MFKKIAVLLVIVFLSTNLMGCASTMQAIRHKDMSLTARMSDTIFLDPALLQKNRNIFVRATNTSDFQEIDFNGLLKNKLSAKGYSITNDPSNAGYIVQANLLYLGKEKEDLTADGMLVGGFGGALAGSAIGGGSGSVAGTLGGAVVGSIVGGLVGSVVQVDTYLGTVDIQIREMVEGGVTGVMETDAKQGAATVLRTQREIKSTHQEYRTRIVVQAKQTNINREVAAHAIAERLASQIAGKF